MHAIDQVALAKSAAKLAGKEVTDALPPGTYGIDATFRVRVTGEIIKAPDTEKSPTTQLLTKATLALALHHAGVTRAVAARAIERAMAEAIELGEDAGSKVAGLLEDVDAALERVQAIVEGLPKTKVSGAVRCKLSLDVREIAKVEETVEIVESFPAAANLTK